MLYFQFINPEIHIIFLVRTLKLFSKMFIQKVIMSTDLSFQKFIFESICNVLKF